MTRIFANGTAYFLFGLFALTGCASLKPSVPRDIDPAKFWKAQKEKQQALQALTAKISVTVDSTEASARGRGALATRLVGKRALRLEVRDPLGRVQYLAVLNGEFFSAFVLGQSLELHDKEAGRRYLRKSLGMDLSFHDVQELVLGILPGGQSGGWTWERPRAPLPRLARSSTQWVDVDPDLTEIREARWKDVQIEYSDFRPCCTSREGRPDADPMVLARRVVFKSLTGRTGELQFDWGDITPLESLKDATFALPAVKNFRREDLSATGAVPGGKP